MEIRNSTERYVGRFAPSPSGNLHFGSLVCALASYLDAKAKGGIWLLRMEDIDPPREQPGAALAILKALENHGLHWDQEVTYQSQRSELYREALSTLTTKKLSYRCNCTRKRLSQLPISGPAYDGHCILSPPAVNTPVSWRLNLDRCAQLFGTKSLEIAFEDSVFGSQHTLLKKLGDFVIHRKDGLFAYNLAVVVDDLDQNVTHIVRGADLLSSVGQQTMLSQALCDDGKPFSKRFHYTHIPLVIDRNGVKLSKQNRAPTIDESPARNNIHCALQALKLNVPEIASIEEMLHWAKKNWQPAKLAATPHIHLPH